MGVEFQITSGKKKKKTGMLGKGNRMLSFEFRLLARTLWKRKFQEHCINGDPSFVVL